MEKEKLIVVDFYEYMSLLENYRKLDVKNRDLKKGYSDLLNVIHNFEDGEITKIEFFYLIDYIMTEQGVKEND